MATVFEWNDLVSEALMNFPNCDKQTLRANHGDVGALAMHISAAHDLTFAEATEMVTFRLPVYVEPQQRLSA